MNSIDVIIPTMWRDEKFPQALNTYCDSSNINRVILIDNDHQRRPASINAHEKLTIVNYGRNIYVNPAWNEGYYRSKADILCLLNDDIQVDDDLFYYIKNLDFREIDIVGVHLKDGITNYHITNHPDQKEQLIKLNVNKSQPIGGQSFAFGVCMFIKRECYSIIPSLYKVWYGDDYLIQRCKNIYTLKTSKIHGVVSKTITDLKENSNIEKRMYLDSKNVYKFNHFFNGKNWDLVQATLIRKGKENEI